MKNLLTFIALAGTLTLAACSTEETTTTTTEETVTHPGIMGTPSTTTTTVAPAPATRTVVY